MTRSDWLSLLVLAPVAWTFVVRPVGRNARADAGRIAAGGAVSAVDARDAATVAEARTPDERAGEAAGTGPAASAADGARASGGDAYGAPGSWTTADAWRRLDEGAPGTYIRDVLADHDSALARWPDRRARPLVVWIQPEPALWDFDPDYVGQVRAAFRAWEDVGIPVRFAFTADSARADLHVSWTDRFREPISGKTIWSRDDDWWIVDATVVLAVRHSSGEPLDAPAVHAIALHEVGHLLGLDHTRDPATIMTPRVRVRALTDADRATARLLYALPPGRVRAR